MQLEKPYFMTNSDWYYYDMKELKYKLKKNAPPKAVQSYKNYYNLILSQNK